MSLAPRNPNTIYLGGGAQGGGDGLTIVDDKTTTGTPLPGMLAQLYSNAGIPTWRAHSTSAGTFAQKAFYLERPEFNQAITDAYVANELARVGILRPGSVVYALIPSGQDIVAGDSLESNGDGYVKEGTTAPVGRSLDSPGAVTVATRIRMEVL